MFQTGDTIMRTIVKLLCNITFCLSTIVSYCLNWLIIKKMWLNIFEARCEKTGLRGFCPGPTQTRLYSYRRWLEA